MPKLLGVFLFWFGPWPSNPCFFSISLLFFVFPIFLAFFVLPFKDLRGSAKRKALAFFGGFPCFSSKNARVGGSGPIRGKCRECGKRCHPTKTISTALLLNKVSEKSGEIWNEVLENFSEIFSEIRPEIFRAFLAGRKVFPPNSLDFSHQRFQYSNEIFLHVSRCTFVLLQI